MRSFGPVLLLFAFLAAASTAAAAGAEGEDFAKGFRGIPWGTPLEEVRKRFPDLVQETYGTEGEADHFVRDRSSEEPRIDGVRFDRIEYHFRKGAFTGIVATIRTKAEGLAFDTLRGKVEARSGKPDSTEAGRVAWRKGKATVEILRRMNSVWLRVVREEEKGPKAAGTVPAKSP
jgi:hypothetical protein